MKIVVLVGNPRSRSRTRELAETVAETLLDRLGGPPGGVKVPELAEIVGVSFGPQPAYGAKDGPDPFATVRSSRLLVVATPAYKGSYTGLLSTGSPSRRVGHPLRDRVGLRGADLLERTATPAAEIAVAQPGICCGSHCHWW